MTRRTAIASVLAGAVLVLGGCQDSAVEEAPAPTAGTIQDAAAAQEAREQFFDAITGREMFRAEGSIEVSGTTQEVALDVDVADQAYAGTISLLGADGRSLSIEIVRASGLTWIKAPAEYWVQNGYTEEGAERAVGKYIVFEQAAGDQIAEAYDYPRIIRSLRDVPRQELDALGPVECADEVCQAFALATVENGPVIRVPEDQRCANGECALFALESQVEGARAVVEVSAREGGPITHPDREDVLEPEAAAG